MAVAGAVVTGRIVAGAADVVADDVADEDVDVVVAEEDVFGDSDVVVGVLTGVEVVLFTQLRCPDFTKSTE